MVELTLKPNQLAAPIGLAVAGYFFATAEGTSAPIALMAALAIAIHMTNIGLRAAEYTAVCEAHGVGVKDIFARAAMVIFDAVLVFGLVTAAGLRLSWDSFVLISGVLVVVLPCVVAFMSKNAYPAKEASSAIALHHWTPPLFVAMMAATFFTTQAVVVPSGSQPYAYLILLSSVFAATRSTTRAVGLARAARFGALAATLILLIWNYLNIT